MSYASEKERPGRHPFTIVEIDLDYCQLTYGTSPCTAALGSTGSVKCYNTRATCQDPNNYDPAAKTYRYCSAAAKLPIGLNAIPSLRGVSVAPTRIDVGGSLGQRASATINLQDHAHHDRGIDKYWAERASENDGADVLLINGAGDALLINGSGDRLLIDAAGEDESTELQGTYWGRLRARNPYYLGRPVRIKTGYLTDPIVLAGSPDSEINFITRTYFLESIAGPDASGKVAITAKDPLKLLDDERAQAPTPNSGTLLADITDVATSATLTVAGIGDDEYAASGYVRIGREVMAYTRSGDDLTLTRAQYNTAASAHSAGDAVQECLLYTAQTLDEIVYDLIVNYGGLSSGYIPLAEWQSEAASYLTSSYSAIITEPTGVKTLLTELVQQAPFYIWWDERNAEIVFRALRSPDSTATTLNEDEHFIADSVSVADKPGDRLSQVWVYSAQIDPTEQLTRASNYSRIYVAADPDAEGADKFGQAKVKKIYSRWILTQATAADLADQLLLAFTQIPRMVSFSVDAKDSDHWTGDQINIQTRQVQDVDGSTATLAVQIIESSEAEVGHRFKHIAQARTYTVTSGRYQLIYPVTRGNVNFRNDFVAQYGSDDTAPAVDIIILANVILGGGVAVGDWPDDSDLILTNLGRMQGTGGRGGAGSYWDSGIQIVPSGFFGPKDGGTAFSTRFPISIDNQGEIWGGGGGGSGGSAPSNGDIGGSGGGGAGSSPGAGSTGIPGSGSNPGSAGTTEAGGSGGAGIGGGSSGQSGGDPGQAAGGAAGNAVDGDAFVTWIATGDIRGNQV